MRTLKEITDAIGELSAVELAELRTWLLAREDRLEMTAAFESQIKDSERQMTEGRRPRIR